MMSTGCSAIDSILYEHNINRNILRGFQHWTLTSWKMWSDILNHPKQGNKFVVFRGQLMNILEYYIYYNNEQK